MSSRLRTIAAASLITLAAAAACTSKDNGGDPDATDAAGAKADSGSAGKTSKAGSTNGRGQGGAAATSGGGAETEAGGSSACLECDSGFCLDDGTCVDCLPNNDHCPANQYCTEENECASGCKTDGSDCASGVCDDEHSCKNCINDDECKDDLVCGNGQCAATCDPAEAESTACGSELACCALHCADLATDANNCGQCGVACETGEFCGIAACTSGGEGGAGGSSAAPCVACHPTTLDNVCSIASAIVILDTNANTSDGNRKPGRAIGAALQASCAPTPTLTEAEQDSVEALNLTTGRPVSGGGELLVVAGGPFYQSLEGYLEDQRIAPLYLRATATDTEYRNSATDEVVVTLPLAGDHESHDFFIVQFMRDAASGSLALNVQGFWLSGTVAAAFQVTEGILPSLSSYTKAWYAYEWTDMDDDKQPALNEIRLVDAGG